MSTPDLSAFNFSFDPTLDTWAVSDEPAELDSPEIFLPNVEGRTEFLAPDPDRVPVIENSVRTDDPTYAARPAEERTRELLSQMRPHRATLLGILAACETPMATSAMKETVERISGRKFSVYTPSNFCTMLEVAGGLARVTDTGEPYTDEVRAPEMVEVDSRAFWRPTTPPPVYWQTTEAGATVLAEDDPAARIERLFAKEPEFLPVYKRILLMADTEEGTSMGLMSVAVDTDPAIAENRRFYVQHFVESLERAGAFVWADGAWRATDAGRAALAVALAGKVPGLRIRQTSGMPGSFSTNINVRGMGTPMIVIDGVVRNETTEFQKLNPEDIESITVLKDASAAIYGINSSNGAILVTTKAGSQGPLRVSLNANWGFSQPTQHTKMMNAHQYWEIRNEDGVNSGGSPYFATREELQAAQALPNVDWYN